MSKINRLTKKYKNGIITLDADKFPNVGQETLDREIGAFAPFRRAVEALYEYEDAEENGTLVRLPCEVGDIRRKEGNMREELEIMRDILFRGKRTDNGAWVEGIPFDEFMICGSKTAYHDDEVSSSNYTEFDYIEVIPETVGQWTGLTDKNGKLIFEGDILEFTNSEGIKFLYLIYWDYYINGWAVISENMFSSPCKDWISREWEIVGNDYDTPRWAKALLDESLNIRSKENERRSG